MDYSVSVRLDYKKHVKDNTALKYKDYSWWIEIMDFALRRSDIFEMRMWREDRAALLSATSFGMQIDNKATDEIVYKGYLTEDIGKELKYEFLNRRGFIKWFSLNLWSANKLIFSSENYGENLYLYINEDDLEEVRLLKENPYILDISIKKIDELKNKMD